MDIYGRHQSNHQKLDKCLTEIQSLSDIVMKSQMWTFYNNARKAWVELDKEFIECKKYKKITFKYTEFESKFDECVKEFHRWSLVALLTQK